MKFLATLQALRARHLTACLAGLGLLAPLCGLAADMDFQQAYEAAAANDALVRVSRAATRANQERLPQAKAQLRPNISVSAGRNYNDLTSEGRNALGLPARSEVNYYSGSQALTVRQPLYRPYLTALVRQAEAQVSDCDAALERDEQSLLIRVAEGYFEALLANDQLVLILAQKEAYTTQLDAASKGFTAGAGTRTDVDEAQARVDLTLAQELEARQNVDFTLHRIATLTGDPTPSLALLDISRFAPAEPMPASVDAWISQAEQTSPELQSLRSQVEAAREEVNKAQAGHLPTLDAVAQWARSSSDSVTSVNSKYDNKSIGLQLSVPLYAGGYVSSTVRQAVANLERAEEALEATRRDLGVRIHHEFRGMTEGVLRIKALEQAVRSAEQSLLSNQKSFQGGSRTTVDVLNAQQQKTLAMRDLAQARYLYLVSRVRLQSLAGEIRQMTVAQVNASLAR